MSEWPTKLARPTDAHIWTEVLDEGLPPDWKPDWKGEITMVIPSSLGRELFNALNAATPRGCGCRQCKASREVLEHYESEVQL